MSFFDEILPEKKTSPEKFEFSVACGRCGSKETEAFRAEKPEEFTVFCQECGNSTTIRIPGV